MILIAVGTQKFPFKRLLKKVDELIEGKNIQEDVIAQTGFSQYIPRNYSYEKFINEDSFIKLINQCEILITHGGIGTITKGLKLNKRVIIVPRMKKYGEHIDDHQIEIANEFERRCFATTCKNTEKLGMKINKVRKMNFAYYNFSEIGVAQYVRKFILELEGK